MGDRETPMSLEPSGKRQFPLSFGGEAWNLKIFTPFAAGYNDWRGINMAGLLTTVIDETRNFYEGLPGDINEMADPERTSEEFAFSKETSIMLVDQWLEKVRNRIISEMEP